MVTPEKVAKTVVRAIEKDKAEIVLMPGPGRLLKALMDLYPGFGPTMNRISGGEKVMSLVADHREAQPAATLRQKRGMGAPRVAPSTTRLSGGAMCVWTK